MTAPDRSSTGLLAQADAIRKLHVEPWEEEDREHIARRVAAIALAGARPAAGPDAEHERMDDQVLRERDEAIDAADTLAGMVAPSTIVGEHSNSNEPWQNAMGYAGGPWGSQEARHGPWCLQAVAAARPAGDDTAPPADRCRCGVRRHTEHMKNCPERCRDCGGDPDGPNPCCHIVTRELIAQAGPRAGDTAPDQCPTSCDDVRTRMEQVQRDNARLINELVRLRSDAAALRAAGDESDDVLGAMLRELAPIPWGLHEDATAARDRWRSAAGSPATPEADDA